MPEKWKERNAKRNEFYWQPGNYSFFPFRLAYLFFFFFHFILHTYLLLKPSRPPLSSIFNMPFFLSYRFHFVQIPKWIGNIKKWKLAHKRKRIIYQKINKVKSIKRRGFRDTSPSRFYERHRLLSHYVCRYCWSPLDSVCAIRWQSAHVTRYSTFYLFWKSRLSFADVSDDIKTTREDAHVGISMRYHHFHFSNNVGQISILFYSSFSPFFFFFKCLTPFKLIGWWGGRLEKDRDSNQIDIVKPTGNKSIRNLVCSGLLE